MSAAKIKGSLLEFIVRRVLLNCGFTLVIPDGLFIYKQRGLTFINGKGAAHDADVLLNPPMQIPFSYPSRINFECKAYNKTTGLTIIRNALGLRFDINEFEIVTKDHIRKRQNNRRSILAIDNRQRFQYQVGVATVEDFSKDAFEFAANNKIPLICLRWFLPDNICDLFHQITDVYLSKFDENDLTDLTQYLKGNDNFNGERFTRETDSHIRTILKSFYQFEKEIFIGLLESGDMLFLFSNSKNAREQLLDRERLFAQFHYKLRTLDYWTIRINKKLEFSFYLPSRIIEIWRDQNFNSQAALNLKQELFSRLFLFIKNNSDTELPFRIVDIDRKWMTEITGRPE